MDKNIIRCLVYMASQVEAINTYGWSNEYKIKHLNDISKSFYKELSKHIDVTRLTIKEFKEMGFKQWSEDIPNLWLFPLWIIPLIPEGLEVVDIFGEKYLYDSEKADNDTRLSCVSYGIEIKN